MRLTKLHRHPNGLSNWRYVQDRWWFGIAHVAQVFPCGQLFPAIPWIHCNHVAHVFPWIPCAHVAHVSQFNTNQLIKLYTYPLVAGINIPLALVLINGALASSCIVRLALNHPWPHDHSNIIPVPEALLPSLVKNIVLIYWIAFGAIGTMLNAVVTKKTHDSPKKNRTRYLKIYVLCLHCIWYNSYFPSKNSFFYIVPQVYAQFFKKQKTWPYRVRFTCQLCKLLYNNFIVIANKVWRSNIRFLRASQWPFK